MTRRTVRRRRQTPFNLSRHADCGGQDTSRMNAPEALTIVVGYEASAAARRGVARVRGASARSQRVLRAAVAPALGAAGLPAEPAGGASTRQRLAEEFPLCSMLRGTGGSRSGRPAVIRPWCSSSWRARWAATSWSWSGGAAGPVPVRVAGPWRDAWCIRRRVTCRLSHDPRHARYVGRARPEDQPSRAVVTCST